jgi:hypothetical protein
MGCMHLDLFLHLFLYQVEAMSYEAWIKAYSLSQAPVIYACNLNLNYSRGRDPGGSQLKPVWANCSGDPILKDLFSNKKGWWSGSRCRP